MLQSIKLTLLICLLTVSIGIAQSKPWDNDPKGIKVFILAGQSNMVGYGKTEDGGNPDWVQGSKDVPKEIKGGIGCLRYLAIHDEKFPEYDYAALLENPKKPETSPWKNRKDVKVWWRNGASAKLGGPISKGDLGPPFQGAHGAWFGPEFAFGQIIGDYYKKDDVLIIKAAWGGHALASNFRCPTAVKKRGGEVGASYQQIFLDAHEVLDDLGAQFPEWKGKGYQIVGFGWHQGFNDRVTNSNCC
jgi:alpha-galactosidase